MEIRHIAIVGTGIMGNSWAIVYARAGFRVSLYDREAGPRALATQKIRTALEHSRPLLRDGDTVDGVLERITVSGELVDAVSGAQFVHECIEEKIDSKKAIFAELSKLAEPNAILASSTSSFPVSTFASELDNRERCIVVHPATPPHLLPVTEVCPAPFTDEDVTSAVFALLRECGQVPVLIKREIPSFVLNRLQGALIVEMFRCLNDDIISPADMDTIISEGFGLRWAFLGPFEAADLSSSGGVREYFERFGFIFNAIASDFGIAEPVVVPASIDKIERYVRERLPISAIASRAQWRDESIISLRTLKISQRSPTLDSDGPGGGIE